MELRQFSETGVPLLGTLAEQLGKTESEIMEMVSAGEIGFEQVRLALASLTEEGGKFNNLMERQSQSLAGQWSNFKDQISLTARAIGQELLPYLKPMMENLIAITQAVGEFVKEHPKLSAGLLAAALAFTALLAVLLPIAIVLPGLILMFPGLSAAFVALASVSGLLVIAFLLVLGATLLQVYRVAQLLGTEWDLIWLGMKVAAADTTNAVIGFVETMVNYIIEGVNVAIRAINKVVSAMARIPIVGNKFQRALYLAVGRRRVRPHRHRPDRFESAGTHLDRSGPEQRLSDRERAPRPGRQLCDGCRKPLDHACNHLRDGIEACLEPGFEKFAREGVELAAKDGHQTAVKLVDSVEAE